MRILVFHGYLLGGTGSNVYNSRLAAAFVKLGHEVHLLSQDRHPQEQPFVDAVGDWDEGTLQVHELHEDVRCTVYRPNIGQLLPVYVADRYEGIEARPFADCSDEEIDRYIAANVAAVRELVDRVAPDIGLANHLVMGPVILARALGHEGRRGDSRPGDSRLGEPPGESPDQALPPRENPRADRVPYAIKVHGSALEYTVKPHPVRFLPFAREGLAGARGVLVGSHHTAASLWAALEDPELPRRTRLGPPGVDVERFTPREPDVAASAVRALAERLQADAEEETGTQDAFARDTHAAGAALARLEPGAESLVAFVGKLIVSKGVDLLLAAWPLVLESVPRARLVVVGFGAYRGGLERLSAALASGHIQEARAIAEAGRALEGHSSDRQPLRHLLAFLDSLHGEPLERYLTAARGLQKRVVLTGRLDHEELAEILPACEALVVPSTFPEAFGMVAAEAAACGTLPVSAGHSGLAEVSDVLAQAVPEPVARLLSFPVDDDAVRALAERVVGWLALDPDVRLSAREGLVQTVRERWSWDGVARGVIAAARGELDGLQAP